MSKRKKAAFRERDEIEEYFNDVKSRSFPIGIIFILLLIAIIGLGVYYYFIIDNPKNIFLSAVSNTLDKFNYQQQDKINYEFSLDTDINTTNKEYIDIVNLLEKIALNGKGSLDLKDKKNYSELTTYYQSEKLLSINTYYEDDEYLYLESKDLFDKVIKIKNVTEKSNDKQENDNNNSNIKLSDIAQLFNSLKEVFKDILTNATYQKEYVELSETKVKKVTLIIDKDLSENFYNKLLDSKDFMKSYSKVMEIDISEAEKEIKDTIDELDNEVEKVSLYLSILDNKFIMLEDIYKKERITVTKDNNTYNYKIYDDSIIEYQGCIEFEKTNNEYQISFEYDNIKEEIGIVLNLDLLLEYNQDIEAMDTKNALDYEKLNEKDLNKIMNNLSKNKAYTTLTEDVSLIIESYLLANQNNAHTTA